jgi:hypothetical protein
LSISLTECDLVQGDYILVQGEYILVQGGYIPVQAGYIPVQGGYIPVQGGYIPVQGGYIIVQGSYILVQGVYNMKNCNENSGISNFAQLSHAFCSDRIPPNFHFLGQIGPKMSISDPK